MPVRETSKERTQITSADGDRRQAVEAKIASALHEMLRSGALWSEVTVEKIASAAGIKRTLFYVYYPDRNSVLIRLGNELIETTTQGMRERWLVEMDGPDGIRREMEAFMEVMVSFLPVARALMDGASSDVELRTYWSGLITTLVQPTTERLEETWRIRGLKAPADPRIVAYSLCRMTEKVITDGIRDGIGDSSSMLDAIYAIWVSTFYYDFAD